MRKVVLYIAMSLDGYVADPNGGIAWLEGDGSDPFAQTSYDDFVNTVDTVILGFSTYNQIVTELSPQYWVYQDKDSYVITSKVLAEKPGITFTNESPASLVKRLKQEEGKDIWICGGATIAQQLLDADAIDVFHLSVIPTVLGGGIKLFDEHTEHKLKLIKTQTFNGIVDLIYERRGASN